MRARFRFRSEIRTWKKTTRAEERSRDDPPAEVHIVHFSDTSMSQQLNLDGWIKLAEHQRRISGTEMGVGEYVAPPPAPKGSSSRDLVTFRMRDGHISVMTPAKVKAVRRRAKQSRRDPFNKSINALAKSARKLCK